MWQWTGGPPLLEENLYTQSKLTPINRPSAYDGLSHTPGSSQLIRYSSGEDSASSVRHNSLEYCPLVFALGIRAVTAHSNPQLRNTRVTKAGEAHKEEAHCPANVS